MGAAKKDGDRDGALVGIDDAPNAETDVESEGGTSDELSPVFCSVPGNGLKASSPDEKDHLGGSSIFSVSEAEAGSVESSIVSFESCSIENYADDLRPAESPYGSDSRHR